jgi:hypothetical protein
VVDTQSFLPAHYDAEQIYEGSAVINKRANTLEQHPTELQNEIRCAEVLRSENLGFPPSMFPVYIQTLRFMQGKLILMTTKGLQGCNHLTWQQSIYDFQKALKIRVTSTMQLGTASEDQEEDLVQVFLRALEIFKGRIKGYQGLVDNAYLRENFLRAELKLLVKEIIM